MFSRLLIFAQSLAMASHGTAAVAPTSAGGGGSASFLSHSSRLCAALLTLPSGAGDVVVIATPIQRIADAYMELLTGPVAGLVSTTELRAMLDSGKFFELPEGSSARDHLRDGLRELESIARAAVRDQEALARELSERLARHLGILDRAQDQSRAAQAKHEPARHQTKEITKAVTRLIALPRIPEIPGAPYSAQDPRNSLIEISPHGDRILLFQKAKPPARDRYLIARAGRGAGPEFTVLKTPAGFGSDLGFTRSVENSFSEDGSLVAAVAETGPRNGVGWDQPRRLLLFDTATGECVDQREFENPVGTVALSPDGARVLVQTFGRPRERLPWPLKGRERSDWFVLESRKPGLKRLSVPRGIQKQLNLHAELLRARREEEGDRYRLAFSPDGTKAAFLGKTSTYLRSKHADRHEVVAVFWDLRDGSVIDSFSATAPRENGLFLRFLRDGKRVLVAYSGGAAVRDPEQGRLAFELESPLPRQEPDFDLGGADVSGDGALIAGAYKDPKFPYDFHYRIGLWDAQTGKFLPDAFPSWFPRIYIGLQKRVSLRFRATPNGVAIVHSQWDNRDSKAFSLDGDLITVFKTETSYAAQERASSDGSVHAALEGSGGRNLRVWDLDATLGVRR